MTTSSWYRRGVWILKGNKEYTKAGYDAARLRFADKDLDVDCSERHFMITGANSGIGLETAVEIARRGGIIHLVCRNASSMKEARSHIITTTGNDRIYQHQVNLSKPKEVGRWVEDFIQDHDRLDVLINNAGELLLQRELHEDDVEGHFAVNVLAVHIITISLLPLLQRSKDPRVITVSSAGMLTVKLDPHDLSFEKMTPFDGRLAYSQTKRQQVVMTLSYAQKYDFVKFFSMHPGWADTPGVKKSLPEFYESRKDTLRTASEGADTVIWLAISEAAISFASGLFFQDRVPVPTHLPLAWTRSSNADEQLFMSKIDKLLIKYCSSNPYIVQEVLVDTPEEGSNPKVEKEHFLQPSTSKTARLPADILEERGIGEPKFYEIGLDENHIETSGHDTEVAETVDEQSALFQKCSITNCNDDTSIQENPSQLPIDKELVIQSVELGLEPYELEKPSREPNSNLDSVPFKTSSNGDSQKEAKEPSKETNLPSSYWTSSTDDIQSDLENNSNELRLSEAKKDIESFKVSSDGDSQSEATQVEEPSKETNLPSSYWRSSTDDIQSELENNSNERRPSEAKKCIESFKVSSDGDSQSEATQVEEPPKEINLTASYGTSSNEDIQSELENNSNERRPSEAKKDIASTSSNVSSDGDSQNVVEDRRNLIQKEPLADSLAVPDNKTELTEDSNDLGIKPESLEGSPSQNEDPKDTEKPDMSMDHPM